MIYSDFLVLKFFRDIVVYEKNNFNKKNFVPRLTRFRISMSPRTQHLIYITLEVLSVSKHL